MTSGGSPTTEPVKIDSHVHLYPTAARGRADKEGYEIWEYGEHPGVAYSDSAGTVDEAVAAMADAGIAKAVVVNLYMAEIERDAAIAELSDGLSGAERDRAMTEIEAKVIDDMKLFNRWICDVAVDHPEIVPFVASDVTALPREAGAAHVLDMIENHGACGVKLHGAAQGYSMSDERLWPIYAVCQEVGVPVVGHAGPDRQGAGFAEPRAFSAMLEAFPRLRVAIAHLGGGSWRQALDIAETHPNAYFDCCEIIEWTGATNAPTDRELGRLIRSIGPDRVMMGSDYPWYDLDHTVDRIMELPVLSSEEKEGILGRNAMRILGL